MKSPSLREQIEEIFAREMGAAYDFSEGVDALLTLVQNDRLSHSQAIREAMKVGTLPSDATVKVTIE